MQETDIILQSCSYLWCVIQILLIVILAKLAKMAVDGTGPFRVDPG